MPLDESTYALIMCMKVRRFIFQSVLSKKPGLRLLALNIEAAIARGVLDLLSDCTPTEFIILYENMASLKKLLRDHV